jgi:hypothetical protein
MSAHCDDCGHDLPYDLECQFCSIRRERDTALAKLAAIRSVVDAQAEDEALWAVPLTGRMPIAEAHLQQELRALHAAVEAVT